MHDQIDSLLPPVTDANRQFLETKLAVGFALAVQPVSAETIHTGAEGLTAGEVKVPVSGGEMPAYRAMPATGRGFPIVLVVHEIFGVHEHIQDLCRRFAKLGYFAIAPNLYSREGDVSAIPEIKDVIANVVSKVPDKQVMEDLDSTYGYAASTTKTDANKLAIAGFCWGGRIVWLYAGHQPKLKAGAAWYGGVTGPTNELRPKQPLDLVNELKAPIIGLYGADDKGIPVESLDKMRDAAKAAGKIVEINVYPNTPHGFNSDYRESYREGPAKEAWAKMLAWFKKYV
jgi:carboxymethylenebutenolidase